ncbi:unnamed protein product [Macrosiphum euphorbiae]|uniref:Transposase n=1 Tax=Macrosiphum euphorbiae TaxID=13131 RepID=A0AAV0XR74_9HEMI|nr:unnamed protein product [Macrosiphum euphorbiae]
MPKRKCIFTDALKEEYTFLKLCERVGNDGKIECISCGAIFSIDHGGKSDIKQHIGTKRHKLAEESSKTKKVNAFFGNKRFVAADKLVYINEGTWAYHVCKHNQSCSSMDCTSGLLRKMYDSKFTCGATKTQAIIVNVLFPYAINLIKNQLDAASFVTVMIDSSNHKDLKIIPVLVRYFLPETGIKTVIIEFTDLPGETAVQLTNYVCELLKTWKIEKKIIALSADNTNTNFGGVLRRGKNNLFTHLNGNVENYIIGIGCSAHILNNSIQSASDTLPIDLQMIISKIFQHFYIYSVRVNTLKEFCDFVNSDYKTILGHSKTRWLSLHPALTRLIEMFGPLKSYFLSIEKCLFVLKTFFENPISLLLAMFLNAQCELFSSVIRSIEGNDISVVEVKIQVDYLKECLIGRQEGNFITSKEKTLLNNLRDEGLITEIQFRNYKNIFYSTCLKYIDQWVRPTLNQFDGISWITLKNIQEHFNWDNMIKSITLIKSIVPDRPDLNLYEAKLFDEMTLLKNNLMNYTPPTDKKLESMWVDIFKIESVGENLVFSNLKNIVEFFMCIPGTNASVERVFSHMNCLWTDEKNRLNTKTVKATITVKLFFHENCAEFHHILSGNEKLQKEIHSSQKYEK